jgi:hypothetical protein
MSSGAEIKTTRLSDSYSFEQFQEEAGNRLLLLAWNEKGRLEPHSSNWGDLLDREWTIASLSLDA